jgi:large subunit ribosomal protein L10
MLRQDKERIVEELAARLRDTQTLMVADYRGLSMKQIDALRTKLLEHGARFTVVKNTLTRRAAEEAGADAVLALLDGPTAIAFLDSDGDPVAVAKALADSARETRVLEIRGGILDGRAISEDDVRNLATLPPVELLRGQVLGAISAPLLTVVGLFSAPLRDLVGLIDARIEQLGGEAAEAPSEEPAAESEEAPAESEEAPGEGEEEPQTEPEAQAQAVTEDQPAEEDAEAASEETTEEE